MVKVAFWYDRPQEYTGGLNYMRNLLFALAQLEEKKIHPYIFFGKRVDAEVVRSFEGLATVVRTSVLDRKSLAWYFHKILVRFFGSLLMVHLAIRRYGISIISHAEHVYGKSPPFLVISWIPDFQYLHLPELFPGLNTVAETKRLRTIAAHADALILSSYAALDDYHRIADPANGVSVTVLQFVSQPSGALQAVIEPQPRTKIEAKYGFQGRFFFLPNQFWQHKNHAVVFAAVRALKEQGIEILLLCTGNLLDYRMKDTLYVDGLQQFIRDNDLNHNINILGAIDYADVLFLMRNCVAVINPSRFEGWSSTVEEAKSMGKRLILSNIPVHLEQDPSGAVFFESGDEKALAQAMAAHWINSTDTISEDDAQRAARKLKQRTLTYAEEYSRLVLVLAKKKLSDSPRRENDSPVNDPCITSAVETESQFMSNLFIRKLIYLRAMGLRHFLFKVKSLFVQPRIRLERHLVNFCGVGLEIGGPSDVFRAGGLFPVYETAKCVHNVTFSKKTCWEGDVKDGKNFIFHPRKEPGTQFILEGGGLSSLPDQSYDFILSSHMLEHTANPLSVLHEWKRLLKTHGNLLLILPHRDGTFDHMRPVTALAHLVDDFEKTCREDDITHLQEILTLHDLRRDPHQASVADFEKWIRTNEANRGAHHHVFDIHLSVQMLTQIGFQLIEIEAAMPHHIFVLATKLPIQQAVSNESFLDRHSEPYRNSPFRSDCLYEEVA